MVPNKVKIIHPARLNAINRESLYGKAADVKTVQKRYFSFAALILAFFGVVIVIAAGGCR